MSTTIRTNATKDTMKTRKTDQSMLLQKRAVSLLQELPYLRNALQNAWEEETESETCTENHAKLAKKVRALELALATLEPDEKTILTAYATKSSRVSIEDLCEELHVERSSFYRIRRRAYDRFTLALFGRNT